jgi:hypothetical protein
MLSFLIAGLVLAAVGTGGQAAAQYWVVGNLVTNSCAIVSQSPVVSPNGPIWFGTGPFKTADDAKQARSGISACPRAD